MWFSGNISRSPLADANENRDWRIYADFARVLIHIATGMYKVDEFRVALCNTVYALDPMTIDLCLSLFPWAHFRIQRGAIKLHALLDMGENLPSYIQITDGKAHAVNILDDLIPEPDSYYTMVKKELFIEALWKALRYRKPRYERIHHSDRRSQCCAREYRRMLERSGFQVSRSRKNCFYNNASTKIFRCALIQEFEYQYLFRTRLEAKDAIQEWIEVFYSRILRHSSLGNISPIIWAKKRTNERRAA